MNYHSFLRHTFLLGCLLFALDTTAQTEPSDGPEIVPLHADENNSTVEWDNPDHHDATVHERGADAAVLDDTDNAIDSTLPQAHDLSPWGMFQMADWVVKSVMIGLALASLATWTVLVAKTRELHSLMKSQRQTLAIVGDAQGLEEANHRLQASDSMTDLTEAATEELQLSRNALADAEGVKERVVSRLDRIEAARGRKIAKGTSILATIGSTAPFVGLFGTVWGIMNSFIGIAESQTTNLAVVAPGIAEALLATALGLMAAIPAVVIYNHFARQILAYRALVGDTSAAILRLVSRDLSRFSVTGQAVFSKE